MDAVYDAEVIAKANGDLAGRQSGNKMDIRLCRIEECLSGARRAVYNQKLLTEYLTHVTDFRNDAIASFIRRLADQGFKASRSTLSSSDHGKALSVGWPSHDQHLLAAALEGDEPTVFVIEEALAVCAAGVRRKFRVLVSQL